MIRLLRNYSFARLWLGGLLSLTGSQVSRTGLILYIFNSRDSVFSIALLVILEMIPGACLAPVAGSLIDGRSKRNIMIAADLMRLLLLILVLWRPTLSIIYLAAALNSVANIFFQPAKAASVPLLVGREDLVKANGLDQSTTNVAVLVGPIIGAELLLYCGLAATLIVDAVSFLASALLIMSIKDRCLDEKAAGVSDDSSIKDLKAGWRYLTRHRLALHLNLLFLLGTVCGGMWIPLAPFFIRDQLNASERLLGWQIGALGMGAMLGALSVPRLTERFGKGIIFFAGLLLEGLSLTIYALVFNINASMVIIFIWGFVVSIVVVPFYSILQLMVEEQFLGRVFSVVKQSENCALVLAMLVAILLQGSLASYLIFLIVGLFYLGIAVASSLSRNGRTLLMLR